MREEPYTDISTVEQLFRPLEDGEMEKALALIPVVEDSLRQEALNVGKDLDALVESGRILPAVLQSVVVDIVGRTLLTSTRSEPMSYSSLICTFCLRNPRRRSSLFLMNRPPPGTR